LNLFSRIFLKSTYTWADLNACIYGICFLPDVTQTFERANLTISGWGYTIDKGGVLSPDLRFAYVTGWNNTACAATGYGKLITDNMICASTPKIDTDACQGDSGGFN
jgi:hypothetical protein